MQECYYVSTLPIQLYPIPLLTNCYDKLSSFLLLLPFLLQDPQGDTFIVVLAASVCLQLSCCKNTCKCS
jgi:hypothetical protein